VKNLSFAANKEHSFHGWRELTNADFLTSLLQTLVEPLFNVTPSEAQEFAHP
jgi:hypothetical protein